MGKVMCKWQCDVWSRFFPNAKLNSSSWSYILPRTRYDANVKLMSVAIIYPNYGVSSTSDNTDSLKTQNSSILKETVDRHISTMLGIVLPRPSESYHMLGDEVVFNTRIYISGVENLSSSTA